MNIVVCYKIVPDEQDAVVQADRTLSFERAALKIGDYDLNAVEAGAQLASASGASLVVLAAASGKQAAAQADASLMGYTNIL